MAEAVALEAKILTCPSRWYEDRGLGNGGRISTPTNDRSNNIDPPPPVDVRRCTALHAAFQRIDIKPDVVSVLLNAYGCGSARTRDNVGITPLERILIPPPETKKGEVNNNNKE